MDIEITKTYVNHIIEFTYDRRDYRVVITMNKFLTMRKSPQGYFVYHNYPEELRKKLNEIIPNLFAKEPDNETFDSLH